MNETKRLRRVAIICCNFARNYACYKAGWDGGRFKLNDQFWISINSNFLDVCVLEWYKLFGNYNDKHHWKQIMRKDPTFKARMLASVSMKQTDLDRIHGSIKSYRDKFVAHLDSDETMKIPKLGEALELAGFYYTEVKKLCSRTQDLPQSLEAFYDEHFKLGAAQYDKHT